MKYNIHNLARLMFVSIIGVSIGNLLYLIIIDYQGVYTKDCWEYCLGGYVLPNLQCGCELMPVSTREEERKICTKKYEFYIGENETDTNRISLPNPIVGKCYTFVEPFCENGYSCIGGLSACPSFEIAENLYSSANYKFYDNGKTGKAVSQVTYCSLINETYCLCKSHRNRDIVGRSIERGGIR